MPTNPTPAPPGELPTAITPKWLESNGFKRYDDLWATDTVRVSDVLTRVEWYSRNGQVIVAQGRSTADKTWDDVQADDEKDLVAFPCGDAADIERLLVALGVRTPAAPDVQRQLVEARAECERLKAIVDGVVEALDCDHADEAIRAARSSYDFNDRMLIVESQLRTRAELAESSLADAHGELERVKAHVAELQSKLDAISGLLCDDAPDVPGPTPADVGWSQAYADVECLQTALTAANAAREAAEGEAKRLKDALQLALLYGLPPHDVSGQAEWLKARQAYYAITKPN